MRQANCPMFPIHRMLIFPTFFFFFCLNRPFLIPFVPFAVQCLVAQSCPTLCDPRDCSLPGSSVHGDSPGKNTGVGCRALLQGIFPAQGLNPGLPNCRQFLYHLSEEGSPLFPLAVIFFLRFFFFWMGTVFKAFIEFVTLLLHGFMFCFFGLEACGILAPWAGIKCPTLPWKVLTTGPLPKSPFSSFRCSTTNFYPFSDDPEIFTHNLILYLSWDSSKLCVSIVHSFLLLSGILLHG